MKQKYTEIFYLPFLIPAKPIRPGQHQSITAQTAVIRGGGGGIAQNGPIHSSTPIRVAPESKA